MPLAAGTSLGPYEIVSPIGAGGMGEVYKARDTRLDRIVAIKVLPAHFASRDDFRQRFEREARAVSSLNHPHICALYDVGRQDGIDYLVMEYLEGEVLKGPLPLDKLRRYAIEIAEALDQAHRKGLAHRDLKPGNILVTKAGVKLLDFGLAKSTPRTTSADDVTLTMNLTQEGSILGTLPYMAPEQLEGKDADARSDIFAFGAVLYEMAAGKLAFEGKSQASLIGNILHQEPPPVSPPALDRIVKRCLRKDPEERWQSARDLMIELRDMAESAPAPAGAPAGKLWKLAAAALLVAAVVPWTLYLRREPPAQAAPVRFQVFPPEGHLITTQTAAVISPDGRRLAFSARAKDGARRLWIRALDALEAQPLPGTDVATGAFWSPDSRELAFFAGGKLKKVNTSGGVPHQVCDAPGENAAGSWASDGTILLDSRQGLVRVPSSGGVPAPVTRLDPARGDISHHSPVFLADGARFLYRVAARPEHTGIYVGSLDGRLSKRVPVQFVDIRSLNLAPQFRFGAGHILFSRDEALMAQRFHMQRLELEGEPFLVAPATSAVTASLSENGVLAYLPEANNTNEELLVVDRKGARLASLGPDGGAYGHVEVSPDNRRLVADHFNPQSRTYDLWSIDIERVVSTRLTFEASSEIPAYSSDGSRVFFSQGGQIGQVPASGAGRPEIVASLNSHHKHASPDGKLVAFESSVQNASTRVWILPLEKEGKAYPLFNGPAPELNPQFSPDGRWIAYESSESGRSEVYVQSFPPGKGKWQVSRNSGVHPRWRRDGKEIYYLEPNWKMMAAEVTFRNGALETGTPKALFEPRFFGPASTRRFAVASDGQRFFYSSPLGEGLPRSITLVVNWLSGVKR